MAQRPRHPPGLAHERGAGYPGRMTIQAAKATLRTTMLKWRAAQGAGQRRDAIDQAVAHLLAHPAFQRAQTIAAYAALPGEPDLTAVFAASWSSGKRVVLPVVARRHHPLEWRVHTPDVALIPGGFRVPIPPPSAARVDPREIDLVIVPALAVDPRGYRVGYGGGYYDRSLPQMPGAARIWLGQPDQQVDAVPIEPTDAPVHEMITLAGVRKAVSG